MADTRFDVAIIGAGIVGLATAMELLKRRPNLKLTVLEKEDQVAAHQTGNNSGVIHSGLYYKPGSLKAAMAVEGAQRMIEFCEQHGLTYELCGKVVLATSEGELPRLQELYRRGTANGVPGLRMLDAAEIKELEPHAAGIAGMHSPRTGIVDYCAVSQTYARIVQAAGGEIRLRTRLTGIEQTSGELVLKTNGDEVHTRAMINCGGLQSDRIASMAGSKGGVRIVPFRGEYNRLLPHGQALVRNLIFPVPDPSFPFLGAHFTRHIDGAVEVGPNAVPAFALEGYRKTSLSPGYVLRLAAFPGFWIMGAHYWRMGLGEMYRSYNKSAFVKSVQKMLPELRAEDIGPYRAGVRAQAMDGRGNLIDDFCFVETPKAIHVLNAPSPAATASLAIGQYIAEKALATWSE